MMYNISPQVTLLVCMMRNEGRWPRTTMILPVAFLERESVIDYVWRSATRGGCREITAWLLTASYIILR